MPLSLVANPWFWHLPHPVQVSTVTKAVHNQQPLLDSLGTFATCDKPQTFLLAVEVEVLSQSRVLLTKRPAYIKSSTTNGNLTSTGGRPLYKQQASQLIAHSWTEFHKRKCGLSRSYLHSGSDERRVGWGACEHTLCDSKPHRSPLSPDILTPLRAVIKLQPWGFCSPPDSAPSASLQSASLLRQCLASQLGEIS